MADYRSEMGELLYCLKYQGDASVIGQIVDKLGKYKGLETMDAIIPVPSTNKQRKIQPVQAIAKALASRINGQEYSYQRGPYCASMPWRIAVSMSSKVLALPV